MRQQLLDLQLAPRYAYAEWVRHAGVEQAQNRLASWLVHGGRLWLTSEAPAGKTHLAHLAAHEHPHIGLVRVEADVTGPASRQLADWLEAFANAAYWVADIAAGKLSQATGIALFHLLERAREDGRHLALFWRCSDAHDAPPELMSRLATLERVELRPPARDDELAAVLASVAASRQWHVQPDVIRLMLTHLPRELHALISAMRELEEASLAEQRRLTRRWAGMHLRDLNDSAAARQQQKLFSGDGE